MMVSWRGIAIIRRNNRHAYGAKPSNNGQTSAKTGGYKRVMGKPKGHINRQNQTK
jgi:hypothetical protein